jgi:tetratricopeptide (TPR) repeat protein
VVPAPEGPAAVPPEKQKAFAQGLALMARHERAGDWTAASCDEAVALLLSGAAAPAASYDAGLVQRRCKREGEARALFEAALARDPSFYPARTALALSAAEKPGGLDGAIAELQKIVRETRFGDADTLISLATLEMRRGAGAPDEEGADDLARARKNLHRALAIDDTSMPAHNQMALLHLAEARRSRARAGERGEKKAATQALELAAVICSQAIAKNRQYAPLHNTAGLIEVELGDISRAAAHFEEARRLDPRLVEAHMNLAALNLGVRGFARAEEAYRAVLALHPDDYDARVGLALAIRGQIDEPSLAARVAAATEELERAKKIAPDRPEAYFNQAILVQEYGARANWGNATDNLARAKGLFEQFIVKADGAASRLPAGAATFADARERARERLKDIEQMAEVAGLPAASP